MVDVWPKVNPIKILYSVILVLQSKAVVPRKILYVS